MGMEQQKILVNPNNISGFKVNNHTLFKVWLKVTKPDHKLTDKEIDIASIFLRKYFENKDLIIDEELLNRVTFSIENKRSAREELGVTPTYFQVMLKGLRDKGFIVNNLINPKFIPTLDANGNILHLFILKNAGDIPQIKPEAQLEEIGSAESI